MIYDGEYGRLTDLEKVVSRAARNIRAYGLDRFDCLVACGLSGVVVAAPLSLRLGKPLVIVRKQDDRNMHHLGGEVIGPGHLDNARWLFIDDFISSGRTINYVKERVLHEARGSARYAGVYTYSHPGALIHVMPEKIDGWA